MQTFTGRQYLKIDIASNFGLDHQSWDDRISWFDQNEHQLDSLLVQAEKPAMFYAGVQAWHAVNRGEPIGHLISLDATSSGLQILAALTGDRSAAEICNVVDTGYREDAYSAVYNLMLQVTGRQAQIDRSMAKEAVMTSLYGSTAVPKRIFGEGELLQVFYDCMEHAAPAAWELNQAMLKLWNPEALSHDWVLPDNFHVHTKVMDTVRESVSFYDEPFEVTYRVNQPVSGGRALGANTIHSIDGMIVREMTRRCDYDPVVVGRLKELLNNPSSFGNETGSEDDQAVLTLWNHYQQSGYLSARILDHLNEKNIGHVDPAAVREMIATLPDQPFKLVSIHDCFRCLPHYGNDMRFQYNWQLHLIARSNLLEFIIGQLVGKKVSIGKLDPTLAQDIPLTNYALS